MTGTTKRPTRGVWRSIAVGLAVLGWVSAAHAVPPTLTTTKSAAATATCQEAALSLQVSGTGDPVTSRLPLDVMIVFDRSGSMDDLGGNPAQPLFSAKTAAKTMVDQLVSPTDRAGLTAFSTSATLSRALTTTLANVKTSIDGLSASGNTNIGGGVLRGQQELAANGRAAPVVRVIVVLSDGVANRTAAGGSCPNTPSSPNSCTQDAVNQAAAAKAAGTVIFTIGLNLSSLPSATATLARNTLQTMASNAGSYFESPSAAQLEQIFSQIATIITNIAGSNIVVTEVLPSDVQYVAGSAAPAPTSVVGQTLTWNLGLLNIGNSASITYRVNLDPLSANQLLGVVPTSRVDYSDYQGNAVSTPLPETRITLPGCPTATPTHSATPAASHTATWTATAVATATATPTTTGTATETAVNTATPTHTPVPFCGDGNLDIGEDCDDGNAVNADGCDTTCTVSPACALVYAGTERFVGTCDAPNFPDIQAAVDASSDGDTVSVCPGSYTDPVVVTKQIAIRAADGGAVTVHTVGTAFDLRRSGVRIEGLTIQSDTGSAIAANAICPLGQPTCAQPGHGSHLTITGNTVQDSPIGIGWQRRVDCVEIKTNALSGNAAHIAIEQQEGVPATQVSIVSNQIADGGQSGAAVSLSGIGAIVAANSLRDSAGAALVLAQMTGGGVTQVIENNIANSAGDGITVQAGAAGVEIHDNNITDNAVGLANESGDGPLDATENWWDSQTGPSGLHTGIGDLAENRGAGSTTQVVEFLCKPFPQGFPSVLGICSVETAELRQLLPGRAPDLDPFARYIVFESAANMDVDPRTSLSNADGSNEIFLLNRRPKKSLTGVCLGGLAPCDFTDLPSCPPCNGRKQCPGDPGADPIVLNGECVVVTQLSDGLSPSTSAGPRLTGLAKAVVFASDTNHTGANPDASREVVRWSRKDFEKNVPSTTLYSSGGPDEAYDAPAPALNGKYVAVESNANPTGDNADGNVEIFVYKPRSNEWLQVTHTTAPVENRRPATTDGRRVIFDSTGDLQDDPTAPPASNADGNRELFMARIKSSGIQIRQLTDTQAPADTRSGSLDSKASLAAFSSTADFVGQNADGNREIFAFSRRTGGFEQITHSLGGESANPVVNLGQRFVVFESTADLTLNGATNRRIFQYDRVKGVLSVLSRSRFGTNQAPRIRKRRFVVWESTANLTGNNPDGDWVIYVFDRKKD